MGGGGGVRLLMMEILIVRSSNEFDEPDYSAVHAMCPGFIIISNFPSAVFCAEFRYVDLEVPTKPHQAFRRRLTC